MAKYGYAFQQWKAWAEHRVEISVFPISEVHFALYLQHLSESTYSSGRSRKFERGVHHGQLNRRGFTTPINYNVCLLTSIRASLGVA